MWVRLVRAGEVESLHRADGVVVGLEPREEARFGEPDTMAFWRSSMKPFQALPVVADGAAEGFGLDAADLALCSASHGGLPVQVERVEAMLDRLGLGPADLACGPHPPFEAEAVRGLAREGREPGRLHNNCSGKHAGMLALARRHGWPTEGYAEPPHPVQGRIRAELRRWLDVDPEALVWGVDGCGAPTPYLSLRQMARAFARLGRSDDPSARAVVGAMTGHPDLVGGPTSVGTAVMRETRGRVLAKEGAEGVFCATAPDVGWGAAVKVADGAKRALGPAVVEMLASLDLLSAEELERLGPQRIAPVSNTQGRRVGELRAEARPQRAAVAARL